MENPDIRFFFLRFCLMMSLHLSDTNFKESTVVPLYPSPLGYQILRVLKFIIETAQYLHLTYTHPPVHFKSALDCLQHLIQCKCCINTCHTVLFQGSTFWSFSLSIFDPWLVKSRDIKPAESEGRIQQLLENWKFFFLRSLISFFIIIFPTFLFKMFNF